VRIAIFGVKLGTITGLDGWRKRSYSPCINVAAKSQVGCKMKCTSCNLNIGVLKSAQFTINLALRKSNQCPHCGVTIYHQTNPTLEYFKLILFVIFWFGSFLFLLAIIFGRQVGYETALIICFYFWAIVILIIALIVLCNLAAIFLHKTYRKIRDR